MKNLIEKTLKTKNLNDVNEEIVKVKSAIEKRFDLINFNIPETESCIKFMQKLIMLETVKGIMQTSRYRAYEKAGKTVDYSTFREQE